MVSRGALLVATLGGCNWVFQLDPPTGIPADAPVDAPLGAWGAPQPVPSLSLPGIGEEDPYIGASGTELYTVLRDPALGVLDVRVSLRDGADWLAPNVVAEVSSSVEDTTPRLSLDERTLYFASTRPGSLGATDCWRATRMAVGAPWRTPTWMDDLGLNTQHSERTLTECAGRRVLASDRLGSADLFEADGDGVAPIPGASEPVVNEGGPFVTADCLTVYFQADREVAGDFDLYVMTRTAIEAPFSAPARIDELSRAGAHDVDPWVSADGRRMLFAIAPLANAGDTDIVESTR